MNARIWSAAGVIAAVSLVGIAYAQAVIPIRPGMWEITVKMKPVAGFPANAAALMGRPQTLHNCVTPAEARDGMQRLLRGEAKGNCRFTKFRASGGTYNHEMVCTGQSKMVMTASGTYSPTAYTGQSRMVMNGGQMIITGKASGRLVGACKK
jgi:hypothetical protein